MQGTTVGLQISKSVALFVFLVIVSISIDPEQAAAQSSQAGTDPPFLTYENSELGIRISYPQNWQKIETNEGVGFFDMTKNLDLPAGVSIGVRPSTYNSLEELIMDVANYFRDLSSNSIDFKLAEEPAIIALDGNQAYKISFTETDPTYEISVYTMQIISMINGKDYAITFLVAASDYDTYSQIIKKMVDSFEVTSSAGLSE